MNHKGFNQDKSIRFSFVVSAVLWKIFDFASTGHVEIFSMLYDMIISVSRVCMNIFRFTVKSYNHIV
jgi:hypothetical protein